MKSSWKYRSGAITLTVIFFVFNVGLPIVLSSCPMVRTMRTPGCPACCTGLEAGQVNLSSAVDRSCCATVILADRNKTDYVQEHLNIDNLAVGIVIVSVRTLEVVSVPSPAIAAWWSVSSSPPGFRDIPIVNSTLLI